LTRAARRGRIESKQPVRPPISPDLPYVHEGYLVGSEPFRPAYLDLYERGALAQRVEQARAELAECRACPWNCGVDRLADKVGVCRTGRFARVSSAFPHFGEEDCLRGWNGSGTIFFAWCNLHCVFCQNFDISQQPAGRAMPPAQIAALMLDLQALGCHNINLVTPEHVVPQVVEALAIAIEGGLRIPVVYNSSAYDSLASLRLMEGLVDIYMPDFKVWRPETARRLLLAPDYPEVARQAIAEMHRQVGPLRFDEHGLARRGVLIRHLVMPGLLDESERIFRWIAEKLGPDAYVNVMEQYHPAGKVLARPDRYADIARPLWPHEFQEAVQIAQRAGLWRFDVRAPVGLRPTGRRAPRRVLAIQG
jgi:putative pyruvate formate lyase activating enzyme